jgi:putative ABC transport system substrate-binding protein
MMGPAAGLNSGERGATMQRRRFLGLLGGVAALAPATARAQQRHLPVVGLLNSGAVEPRRDQIEGFLRGLSEGGFVPEQNVAIIKRGAEDHYDRLPGLAAELVRQRVNVIASVGGPAAALAAKAATASIPIVFTAVSDPVRSGLVASLNRPGGNVTGNAGLTIELDAKRFEILSELTPDAKLVGALVNSHRPGVEVQEQEFRGAARAAGRELVLLRVGDTRELDTAFATLAERRVKAVAVGADAFFNNNRQQIIILAARHAIAAVYQWREFPVQGGLVSYGPSLSEAYRLSGLYVGRILKGEKPADLPIIQPSKFELVVNLKTARAIGLAVPLTLMARADEVIE